MKIKDRIIGYGVAFLVLFEGMKIANSMNLEIKAYKLREKGGLNFAEWVELISWPPNLYRVFRVKPEDYEWVKEKYTWIDSDNVKSMRVEKIG